MIQEVLKYFGKLRGLEENQLNSRIDLGLGLVNLTEWGEKKPLSNGKLG